jgi:hypothetical protein
MAEDEKGGTPAAQPQLQVHIPDPHADVAYCDQALVSYTAVGFTLDFAQMTPPGVARVVSRVGMSPTHMKLLIQALQDNLGRYEQQFGAVQVTAQMAQEHREPRRGIGFQSGGE